MLRRLTMIILPLFLVTVSTSAAQTPGATPAASPATATSAWSITDSREIQVDGTPIALSPDGQWLAGIGPGKNEVCVWDAETLNPSCVDVGGSIEAFFGGMRLTWAPDSSAFAFSTSDLARLVYGNIYVFDVDQGTASNLTNLDTENNDDAPLYIGASWTPDNQDIIFTIMHGLVAESPAPEIGRISREGGEVETIELPDDWTGADNMMTPPIASADGNLYFVIAGDNDSAGIWRMAPDGSSPEQLVEANNDPVIEYPMIVSESADSRYLNIASMTGLARARIENTFFLLDTQTEDLTSLEQPDTVSLVVFGPDNEAGLMAIATGEANRLHTIDLASGEIAVIENSPEVDTWLMFLPTWANNDTVFLPGRDAGMLITLEREG